jgi:transposase
MELHTIGIDLGKTVFHLVGFNLRGEVEPCGSKDTRCD